MSLYFTLTKKRLFLILLSLIVALLFVSEVSSLRVASENGKTNAQRVNFVNGIGYEIDDSAVSQKEVIIPTEFTDIYEQYNSIQKAAGFDLEMYKGCTVTVFSYPVIGAKTATILNLIVYDGDIIGGDVSETIINGSMLPLIKKGS